MAHYTPILSESNAALLFLGMTHITYFCYNPVVCVGGTAFSSSHIRHIRICLIHLTSSPSGLARYVLDARDNDVDVANTFTHSEMPIVARREVDTVGPMCRFKICGASSPMTSAPRGCWCFTATRFAPPGSPLCVQLQLASVCRAEDGSISEENSSHVDVHVGKVKTLSPRRRPPPGCPLTVPKHNLAFPKVTKLSVMCDSVIILVMRVSTLRPKIITKHNSGFG